MWSKRPQCGDGSAQDHSSHLNGDVIPVREPLLAPKSNVHGNLNEEKDCQPAHQGIPPQNSVAAR